MENNTIAVINRTVRRYRRLRRWARRSGITSYRVYDRDIPAAPIAIDLYELLPPSIRGRADALSFMTEEYRRISTNDASIMQEIEMRQYLVINSFAEDASYAPLLNALSDSFGIDISHIIVKRRTRGKGGARYGHFCADSAASVVRYTPPAAEHSLTTAGHSPAVTGNIYECGLLFKADLSSHIDTGIFLDHRPLRAMLRAKCRSLRVLNLFCYTASLSIAAAAGGASLVTSVDLSNTYLDWAKHNAALNGLDAHKMRFVKSDAVRYLEEAARAGETYDIIILDPPTFSNSAGAPMLDLVRDWPRLVSLCTAPLAPQGVLYFSTNSRRLRVKADDAPLGYAVTDITPSTIPPDFPLHKPHRCYTFVRHTADGGRSRANSL